jgi:hypothetical protein
VLAAVTLALLLPPTTDARQRVARLAWSGGCLMFLAHVAAAFHFIHGWSHAAAHAATARDTAALFGIDWGGGIYFNYVFALAWIGDVAWWWLAPRSHAVRPHWVGALWIGFFLFMAFNGAVLFAAGPARWISTLVFAGLAAAALWNLGTDRGRPGLRES